MSDKIDTIKMKVDPEDLQEREWHNTLPKNVVRDAVVVYSCAKQQAPLANEKPTLRKFVHDLKCRFYPEQQIL